MLTADQIIRLRPGGIPAKLVPDACRRKDDRTFDVKRAYHGYRKPSDEFDVKEERERWGGVLSTSPRGFSGNVSGTRTVIKSMNDDMRLSELDKRVKEKSRRDRLFHEFMMKHIIPRLSKRLNADGTDRDYDWHNVPQPCMDTREAAWLEQLAGHRYWVDDSLKGLIVAALIFTVRHGDFNTPGTASMTRCVKNRLVHAHHLAFGRNGEGDGWWRKIISERRASGEIRPDTTRQGQPTGYSVEQYEETKMKAPFDTVQYTAEELRSQADYLNDISLNKEALMLRQAACYVEKFGPWKEEQ